MILKAQPLELCIPLTKMQILIGSFLELTQAIKNLSTTCKLLSTLVRIFKISFMQMADLHLLRKTVNTGRKKNNFFLARLDIYNSHNPNVNKASNDHVLVFFSLKARLYAHISLILIKLSSVNIIIYIPANFF